MPHVKRNHLSSSQISLAGARVCVMRRTLGARRAAFTPSASRKRAAADGSSVVLFAPPAGRLAGRLAGRRAGGLRPAVHSGRIVPETSSLLVEAWLAKIAVSASLKAKEPGAA